MKAIGVYGSAEARGRLNGVVANVWRGIQYLKNHRNPSQPQTVRQQAVRAVFGTVTRAWQDLSTGERATWDAYAASHPVMNSIGQTVYLTGHQWFVGCNSRLSDMGLAQVDTAPLTAAPAAVVALSAADGVGQSVITWVSPGGTDKQLQIFRQGPHSTGQQPSLKRAVLVQYVDAEDATVTVTGLTAGVHTFFARVVDEDNGLVSPWTQDAAGIT